MEDQITRAVLSVGLFFIMLGIIELTDSSEKDNHLHDFIVNEYKVKINTEETGILKQRIEEDTKSILLVSGLSHDQKIELLVEITKKNNSLYFHLWKPFNGGISKWKITSDTVIVYPPGTYDETKL